MLVLKRSAAPAGLNFAADCYIAYDNSKQLKSEPGDSLFWQKDEQKDEGDSARVTQKSEKSIV
jgi:hypothetical protein